MRPGARAWRLAALCALLSACGQDLQLDPEFGVSRDLARHRADAISDVRYDLHFTIPVARTAAVTGRASVSFTAFSTSEPVVLDFRGDSASIANVLVNGGPASVRTPPGHIVIPASALRRGDNVISLTFTAADDALNRNDEFLYALFVPDRASTAFPSFDQPDLKARFRLTLDIPGGWQALSNGEMTAHDSTAERVRVEFDETERLPTYLFTFAAGRFEVEHAERDGRTLTMFHRETDRARVERNRDAIFDLHATALRWLEDYTQIPYPFGKFAFLAVPSFQFGGMEQPGAVWYRASSLFLDESATQNQYLGRASLIAHETAHMWFGDLVTMRWFDDVWMKEVFANLMAAKIVQPSFPEVNHDLRFLLAHHPTAYGVDRTLGANPIRQDLENLRQAGSLYGAIIYQKAPIAMRQLERLIGEGIFRDGLRSYLDQYRFSNAGWPDLIEILDGLTIHDLAAWSRAWVEEPGRPLVDAGWADGILTVTQRDPRMSRDLRWPQSLDVALGYADSIGRATVTMVGHDTAIALGTMELPVWVLPGSDGLSYGRFGLDAESRRALLTALPAIEDPLVRGTGLIALWESVLSGELAPREFIDFTLRVVSVEREELIVQHALSLLRAAYWRFLPDTARATIAALVEAELWAALARAEGPGRKGAYWGAIVGTTLTADGLARLRAIWETRAPPAGLPLSEQQYTSLAEALAVRGVAKADALLDTEFARITNPDRRARFAFVRPALSHDPAVRDSVFESFRDVANRRRESWVLDALGHLGHPLRAQHAERYVAPGLALLDEIQRTGDIFFPLNWLNALLDGHHSVAVAESVERFIATNPAMQPRLRGKVLQAADDLFRAARIVNGWTGGPALEAEGLRR